MDGILTGGSSLDLVLQLIFNRLFCHSINSKDYLVSARVTLGTYVVLSRNDIEESSLPL